MGQSDTMTEKDWRSLLVKYMKLVIWSEGTDFIYRAKRFGLGLSQDELATLEEISKEIEP